MGEGIIPSTTGPWTTRYLHTNEWSCTPYEHLIQKVCENGSNLNVITKHIKNLKRN